MDCQIVQATRVARFAEKAALLRQLARPGATKRQAARMLLMSVDIDVSRRQYLHPPDGSEPVDREHPIHTVFTEGKVDPETHAIIFAAVEKQCGDTCVRVLQDWLHDCQTAMYNLGPLVPYMSTGDVGTASNLPLLYTRSALFFDDWRWRALSAARRLVDVRGIDVAETGSYKAAVASNFDPRIRVWATSNMAVSLGCRVTSERHVPCLPSGRWTRYRPPNGYSTYRATQVDASLGDDASVENKSTAFAEFQHAVRTEAKFLAKILVHSIDLSNKVFGICHGTRTGWEQQTINQELKRLLAECGDHERQINRVIGTDIAAAAAELDEDTFVMDYHTENRSWIGRADFVSSNSLDHAYAPLRAVRVWLRTLREAGALLLTHTDYSTESFAKESDVFGTSLPELVCMLNSAGPYRVVRILADPTPSAVGIHRRILVVQRASYIDSLIN
eukprot:TRINITY_DN38187_c0_g1_i1.p1 TRINITY_DN38187_c0_g1~~TRINITY_DN38187_c0_g1_i1.p1  ORF type:complete len:446 (-),score=13.61 TRINITY_DN38187_c0_g1_i1:196-1533(-)